MLETSSSTASILKAIFAVQKAAPAIKKEASNDYYKSKYAEYPAIQEKIDPILHENNLLPVFFPVSGGKLIFLLTHVESGEFYKVTYDLNSVGASPQAQGSAITYGKRYIYVAVLNLKIEGDDDDGNAGSGNHNKQSNNQQPKQPAAPAEEDKRAWLNKDSQTWFDAKNWLFNKGGSIAKINKKYRISKENADLIAKTELLTPKSKMWVFATFYMSKPEAKPEHIFTMFDISDTDMQDLLIDATNSYPVTEPANANTTK